MICRPPWLQPIVQFEELGGYHGGGVFRSASSLDIDAEAAEVAKMLTRMNDDLPFSVNGRSNWTYPRAASEMFKNRLIRDGFRWDGLSWVMERSPGEPVIRFHEYDFRKYFFESPTHPGLLDKAVDWATYDSRGNLLVARAGVVYRYAMEDVKKRRPTAVIDLEGLTPPKHKRKDDLILIMPTRPEVQVVVGKLWKQDVPCLIISQTEEVRRPLVEAMDEHSKWNLVSYGSDASEVLEVLAGFEIWYADRHWLINVRIPKPEPRSTGLERVCDLAFAAAARHRGRVALRPLGLGEGWTVEQAVIATYDAGLRYAKANQQTVLTVADNILEQRRFANIIKAYSS